MTIQILLVDDHELIREGLRALLESHRDVELVGEASTGIDAVKMAGDLKPDIVLLDVGLPDINGVEATRRILRVAPETSVLGLSIHDDKRFVLGMLQAGAAGYLTKDCALDELERAFRAVAAGRRYLSPAIAADVLEDQLADDGAAAAARNRRAQISPRERDVLRLIAEGMTTKAIASQLHLSPRTVETHRRNIMEKLDLRGIADLTRYAIREGLTTAE